MGPHAARPLGQCLVEQRPPVAPPAVRRVDDQLGDGIRRARPGHLGVAGEGAVIGVPQQVHDPVARWADGQPERLGHRADAVGLGRARPQPAQQGRGGLVDLDDALGARHVRPRAR